jgi:uncharacterized OsmC-like protein
MPLNNIDLAQVIEFRDEMRKDPKEARFTAKIQGEWLFDRDGPQFRATVPVREGTYTMEATHPNFSGPGKYPGPMAFGLFWFAACFTSTFMTDAAMQEVKIDQVKTRVEADLNYLAQFDLGTDPLVEEYRISLEVKSSAPEKKIHEIRDHALKACMGMYTITHTIRLKPELKIIH